MSLCWAKSWAVLRSTPPSRTIELNVFRSEWKFRMPFGGRRGKPAVFRSRRTKSHVFLPTSPGNNSRFEFGIPENPESGRTVGSLVREIGATDGVLYPPKDFVRFDGILYREPTSVL
jgi:hypothetical protein